VEEQASAAAGQVIADAELAESNASSSL